METECTPCAAAVKAELAGSRGRLGSCGERAEADCAGAIEAGSRILRRQGAKKRFAV